MANKLKQPPRRKHTAPPPLEATPEDLIRLSALAPRVCYVCSPYHKPKPFGVSRDDDPAVCPEDLKLPEKVDVLVQWLQQAFRIGAVSNRHIGEFPDVIWYYDRTINPGRFFMAKLSNKEIGQYHGYPIPAFEFPKLFFKKYEQLPN